MVVQVIIIIIIIIIGIVLEGITSIIITLRIIEGIVSMNIGYIGFDGMALRANRVNVGQWSALVS